MANRNTSATTQNPRSSDWQREFEAALLEIDPPKLLERVKAAEAAIFLRQQSLVDSPEERLERQAMADAMRALRVVQRKKLDYPAWGKEQNV